MVIALLTAAGSGTRMKLDIPKQFLHVENKPLIIHTLEKFQQHLSEMSLAIEALKLWANKKI